MSKHFIRWFLPFVFIVLMIATAVVVAPAFTHAAPALHTQTTTVHPNFYWYP